MGLKSFEFINYDEEYNTFRIIPWIYLKELSPETITGKRFWFIEWLVEKNIIDYHKVGEIVDTYKWSLREKAYVVSDCVVESMLMILAIQDTPIDFLVSILK